MTLILSSLTVSLSQRPIVALNQTVRPGEILTLMGPSGSGKSTALAAISGTLTPPFQQTGTLILNGRDITQTATATRRIGLMFQDDILFPHLSVGQNLGFGLTRHVPRKARAAQIEAALQEIGLDGFAPRDPASLSGGQRARVSLMRTLLAEPDALLLDEPFSRLDMDLRGQIRDLVFAKTRALGLPVVLVTHDPADALAAGGPVVTPLGEPVRL